MTRGRDGRGFLSEIARSCLRVENENTQIIVKSVQIESTLEELAAVQSEVESIA